MADGKIYVGTDNGKFFIIRPHADRGEILSTVELPNSTNSCCGSEGTPEQILGGAAISRGRIFFVSSDAVYAIGSKAARALTGFAVDAPAVGGEGAPAHVQVSPTELVATPGQKVALKARLFDARGRFLREEPAATWSLEGIRGTINNGALTIAADPVDQAGRCKATVGVAHGSGAGSRDAPAALRGDVRRATPTAPTPAGWVNTTTNRLVGRDARRTESAAEGAARHDLQARACRSSDRPTWSNYTFEADVRASNAARQMGDVGITAQRYSLVLYGDIAAAQARAVGAGDDAHGHRAVRLESRHVVPPEAARRERSRTARSGRRARPGLSASPNRRRG